MTSGELSLLRFEEAYVEKTWGGTKLRSMFGEDTPEGKLIGEAWLVSDNRVHQSVVAEGPYEGRTLGQLIKADAQAILGARPQLVGEGLFPLLLKILDARQALSVQVHPDDACAKRLGESEGGKTEMWHVLQAGPGSELLCGLDPSVSAESFARAVRDGSIQELMTRFPVSEGTSAFLPAGTVHAAGAGIVFAEIQQNSNLVYRIYDWGRLGADGKPRELHVDKAARAIHFGSKHAGATQPLEYSMGQARCVVLAACRYFAAELIRFSGSFQRPVQGRTCHLLLSKTPDLVFSDGTSEVVLQPGQAVLVPGGLDRFEATGDGEFLDYYVPDLKEDIVSPLMECGHRPEDIARLGGDHSASDVE